MAKKYVDVERLRAKIEKYLTYDNNVDTAFYIGRRDAERSILALIDSLQQEQPEVDLEKEINIEISKWTCYEEIGFGARYDAKPFDGRDIEKIARHFYNLGLNAKEENK